MAGTLSISGTQTGGAHSSDAISFSVTMGTNDTITETVLTSGANTITVPTNPVVVGVIIVPPAGNTIGLTLKGITGDTGVALSKVNPTVITFDTSPPANFCLTAASGFANPVQFIWF